MRGMLFLCSMLIHLQSWSNIDLAKEWIGDHQASNGAVFSLKDNVSPDVSTVSALKASRILGDIDLNLVKAKLYVSENINETYIASIAIQEGIFENNDSKSLIQFILDSHNLDGGQGARERFDSTNFDSALALQALSMVAVEDNTAAYLVSFLLSHQSEDGSWSIGQNNGDAWTTSLVLTSLWSYRTKYADVPEAINKAKLFLLDYLQTNFGNETDLALNVALSVIPMLTSTEDIDYAVDFIRESQLSNGSWNNSVYTTALSILLLEMAEDEFSNPDLASIEGVLIDSDSGQPLSGINVSLINSNSEEVSTLSNSDGIFTFSPIDPSSYKLRILPEDYAGVTWNGLIKAGQNVDLSNITLFRALPSVDPILPASVSGVVRSTETGLLLSGVKVSLDEHSLTLTDSQGGYHFSDVSPGQHSVSFSLDGYRPKVNSFSVSSNESISISNNLAVLTTTEISLNGVIVDKKTSLPIKNATVTLSGSNTALIHTDINGIFEISGLNAGLTEISVTTSDYRDFIGSFSPVEGVTYDSTFELTAVTDSDEPQFSILQGVVTDSQTSSLIENATITVSGFLPVNSNVDGQYRVASIPTGQVEILVEKEGYIPQTAITESSAGTTLLFNPALIPESELYPNVSGFVKDSITGLAISGAEVLLETSGILNTFTDEQGGFEFLSVQQGDAKISITADGYQPYENQLTLEASVEYNLSITLGKDETGPVEKFSIVTGKVSNWLNSELILNAVVSILSEDGSLVEMTTNDQGAFLFTDLEPSTVLLTFSKDGFESQSRTITLIESVILDLSDIKLKPVDTELVFDVVGKVIDSITNEPVANADVSIVEGNTSYKTTSHEDGGFKLSDIRGHEYTLYVSAEEYYSQKMAVIWDESPEQNIYHFRLRPLAADQTKPDLVVSGIDISQASTDPQTLLYSGKVEVTINNLGYESVTSPVEVTVFLDANGDGVFTPNNDPILGQEILQEVESHHAVALAINVSGAMPYRDAPVLVYVDSENHVLEQDELNNVISSQTTCRYIPPLNEHSPIKIKTKWLWSNPPGVSPSGVLGPVAVAQLNDDNNDGIINSEDMPDLVVSFPRDHSLIGLDGNTSDVIFHNPTANVNVYGSVAVGDIDHDGIVEIVSLNNTRTQIMAFEHTGELKWMAPAGPYKSYPRDGISIADIDRDGNPEIIHGRSVYDNDGNKRWEGGGSYGGNSSYGILSIAADINMQGNMEIIAGNTTYDSEGSISWMNHTVSSRAFNSIGNFDDDPYPEIVANGDGKVWLLEHNGSIKWGPISLPGGGNGGPATIADFDGDDEPEIGIAGGSRYVVFETDGSIKWTNITQDYSSNVTGSSVFDFNGDDRDEVIYRDEEKLRIYDGMSGEILVEEDNTSGTTLEYPIIVDIDNDGHAEILVGSHKGVHAYEGLEDNWMPTRSIWNQHAYHITNINDDGSIPITEKHSWISHNNYRLNTFADRSANDTYDLTVSKARLISNGSGQPLSLMLRIGNSGIIASPNTTISLYMAENTDGELIKNLNVLKLEPNEFIDIQVDDIENISSGEYLTAVVNESKRNWECGGDNNSQTIIAQINLGDISVISDKVNYLAGQQVVIDTILNNSGVYISDYTVELSLHDEHGNYISEVDTYDVIQLEPSQTHAHESQYIIGNLFAGLYQIKANLISSLGDGLDEEIISLNVLATTDNGEAVLSSNIFTDKLEYSQWGSVNLTSRIQNLAANYNSDKLFASVEIIDPTGSIIEVSHYQLTSLSSKSINDKKLQHSLADVKAGLYTAQLKVFDEEDKLLSSSSNQFRVVNSLIANMTGSVVVSNKVVEQGDVISCTDQIENRSEEEITDINVKYTLLDQTTSQIHHTDSASLTLSGLGVRTGTRLINTQSLSVGAYSCVLQAEINNESTTLGFDSFIVKEPPVRISTSLIDGQRGRLLLLTDEPRECTALEDIHVKVNWEGEFASDANLTIKVFDEDGALVDTEFVNQWGIQVNTNQPMDADLTVQASHDGSVQLSLSSPNYKLGEHYRMEVKAEWGWLGRKTKSWDIQTDCNRPFTLGEIIEDVHLLGYKWYLDPNDSVKDLDPYGPLDAPKVEDQNTFIQEQLDSRGWNYTLVHSAARFTDEMRNGDYAAYVILSERAHLPILAQKEIREHVFAGKGLLVGGSHDKRNLFIEPALGLTVTARHPWASGLLDEMGVQSEAFPFVHLVQTASLHGAQVDAQYSLTADDLSDADLQQGWENLHDVIPLFETMRNYRRRAVMTMDYGLGQSAFMGYDVLAVATQLGEDSQSAQLLFDQIDRVASVQPQALAYKEWPVEITINNEGSAITGIATLTLPAGMELVSSGDFEKDGQVWTMSFALDDVANTNNQYQKTVYVRLPEGDGAQSINLYVDAYGANGGQANVEASLSVSSAAAASVSDLTGMAHAVKLSHWYEPHFYILYADLKLAEHAVENQKWHLAQALLIGATNLILLDTRDDVVALRLAIDEQIRLIGKQL